MAQPNFELRAELVGHEEDVRGLCVSEVGLFTASRDKTVRLWVEGTTPSEFLCTTTFVGHTNYVGPVVYVPAGMGSESAVVVSGSRDKSVRVWDPVTANCLATLTGHEQQVSCLALGPRGEIYSAALDSTVRVWKRGADGSYASAGVLQGHTSPVLSLVVLAGGDVLSGSGDTTIKRWSGGVCIDTLKAHGDTVRCLCELPGVGFVSASHDMTARVWSASTGGAGGGGSMTASLLAELVGHTALLYACATVQVPGSGEVLVATGAEDDTARIWRPTGECLQVIEHPGCVWAVAFAFNGDLVTACSDAAARLWTRDSGRKAPQELAAGFNERIEAKKAAKAASAAGAGGEVPGLPPGIKVSEPSALLAPGSKPGAQLFVREAGGAVVAYTWDAAGFVWEKLGEVVAAPEGGAGGVGVAAASGGRRFWGGREWDHVFDVEMDDGAPRKLCMDRSENPYLVADRFLEQEGLPVYFKEQIVQFILQNTGQGGRAGPSVNDLPITGGFCDPFTGGSGGNTSNAGGGYGGRPQAPAPMPLASMDITGGGVDPFTGGSSRGAAGAPSSSSGLPPPHTPRHMPATAFMAFDNLPQQAALARKLAEFNAQLQAGSSVALSEAELAPGGPLEQLLSKLPAAAASQGNSNVMSEQDISLLKRLISWPPAQLFPALDVARGAVLDAAAARALAGVAGDVASQAPGMLAAALSSAASSQPLVAANVQLGLRLAVNAFKHAELRSWVMSPPQRDALLSAYSQHAGLANKAVRLSLATLLYNVAVALRLAGSGISGSDDVDEARLQVLSALLELLGGLPLGDEEDAAYRCLVALGTALQGHAAAAGLALDLGLTDVLRRVEDFGGSSSFSSPPAGKRLVEAAIDLMALVAQARGQRR